MTDTTYVPFSMTAAGPTPLAPATLRQQLTTLVAASNPDYTNNLPGSLIEDVASTDVGALSLVSNGAVEIVNTLTPQSGNQYILTLWGALTGVPLGQDTNTSVSVVFTAESAPGWVIPAGFVVSDGTYQYVVQQPGGVIGESGSSTALFAIATVAGTWAVPANTVTALVTSVPTSVGTVTVTNPSAGTPSAGAQSVQSYQAQVQQAMMAASQGMPRYVKTLLGNVPGVQSRLIAMPAQEGGGWEVIVGGGDPYQVAFAIFMGVLDPSTLVGSTLWISGITQANPGVVSTAPYYHGFANDAQVTIAGSDPGNYNGTYTVTVLTPTTFSIGVNTGGYPSYIGSAYCTPNARNQSVAINDNPDRYLIPFVVPPQMTVIMTVTWNTISGNFVNPTTVAALAQTAIANYVNDIAVGAPMNVLELEAAFAQGVASVLPTPLISALSFAVSVNNASVSPGEGTTLIYGDPESYFFTQPSSITVTQG